MDYEQWERGDPFEVAARREAKKQREERECGQCIHKRMQYDNRGREDGYRCVFENRTYGRQCVLFRREVA